MYHGMKRKKGSCRVSTSLESVSHERMNFVKLTRHVESLVKLKHRANYCTGFPILVPVETVLKVSRGRQQADVVPVWIEQAPVHLVVNIAYTRVLHKDRVRGIYWLRLDASLTELYGQEFPSSLMDDWNRCNFKTVCRALVSKTTLIGTCRRRSIVSTFLVPGRKTSGMPDWPNRMYYRDKWINKIHIYRKDENLKNTELFSLPSALPTSSCSDTRHSSLTRLSICRSWINKCSSVICSDSKKEINACFFSLLFPYIRIEIYIFLAWWLSMPWFPIALALPAR